MIPSISRKSSKDSTNYEERTILSTTSPLHNNKTYIQYFPTFIIALSVMYILSFLFRYLFKRYKRLINEIQHQEKNRLRHAWKSNIVRQEFKNSLLFDEENQVQFPPSTVNESFYSLSSSATVQDGEVPCSFYISSSATVFQNSASPSSTSTKTISQSKSKEKSETIIGGKIPTAATIDSKHKKIQRGRVFWNINNEKRLTLLWQWSESMGYLEYDHAKKLNALVLKACAIQDADSKSEVNRDGCDGVMKL